MKWLKEFQNPPAKYRIKPFWFWNGDIKKEEIRHQLKEMSDKGLGGAFICARQGMRIPYLSREWFELVDDAVETASDYGLEAWLYDEYPYPSGMGGGEVLLRHPEAEHKVLQHIRLEITPEHGGRIEENLGWSEVLYAKAFPVRNGKACYGEAVDLESWIGNLQTDEIYQTTGLTTYNDKRFFTCNPGHILRAALPEGSWRVEIYLQAPLGDFKYYGRFFDPCAKEAVKTFLEITHEQYKKYMGASFGTKVLGMFSDEVGLLSPVPWSQRLPEYFREKKGYDILRHLPALHDADYPNAFCIRYDLYDAVHQLFVESYHEQVAGWCRENGLEYATEVPSMRMTTQRHSTIIGGDTAHEKLGRPLEWIYDEYLHKYRSNAKAVSSLARQLDLPFAMIESFHSVGWSMTLQDAKWMFDRLAASGINFFNVHAFYYTIDSIAKHDAPPSQFLQNPYWKHYRLLADYAGRLSAWVSNTKAEISVAVLDPVATLWALLAEPFSGFVYKGENPREKEECDRFRDQWVAVCKELLFHQIDYDHLDAEILAGARIEDGQILAGRAAYRVLILPPTRFLERKAYEKILQFRESGGAVLFLGELPAQLIETGQGNLWDGFWGENAMFFGHIEDEAWCEWCRNKAGQRYLIETDRETGKNLVSSVRRDEENTYFFLANQGKEKTVLNILQKETGGGFMELSLESGERKPIRLRADGTVELGPYESRLLCCGNSGHEGGCGGEECGPGDPEKTFVLCTSEKMAVHTEGGNILRLDWFQMSTDGKNWHPVPVKTFIEQCAQQPVLSPDQLTYVSAFGMPKQVKISYPLKVDYRRTVAFECVPDRVQLMLDRGAIKGEHKIYVNGTALPGASFIPEFINDQNNLLADIRPWIRKGQNEIRVEVTAASDSDGLRDPVYLRGDFGVNVEGMTGEGGEEGDRISITEMPERASLDLDYIKGFPFYSGTFRFDTVLEVDQVPERFRLRLDKKECCHECLEIFINGRSLGVRGFSPYTWYGDGELLRQGKNEVKICLTNTLAAMLDGTWFDYDSHCLKHVEAGREENQRVKVI